MSNAKNPTRRDRVLAEALNFAASQGDARRLLALLRQGADPNAADGASLAGALRAAARGGQVEVARLLLARKADALAWGPHGPALIEAARAQGVRAEAAVGVAEALLGAGARVAEPDARGITPLHQAVERGNEALCRLLLDHGAPLDARAAVELSTGFFGPAVAGARGAAPDEARVAQLTPEGLATALLAEFLDAERRAGIQAIATLLASLRQARGEAGEIAATVGLGAPGRSAGAAPRGAPRRQAARL